MNIPYIGITDFENHDQAARMLDLFEKLIQGKAPKKLMVGVMMSYKTLNALETKWAKVWPKNEQVGAIFLPHPLALNTLHYADFDGFTQAKDLIKAVQYADSHQGLDALQLDMPWPNPVMLFEVVRNFTILKKKKIPIILQVGSVAVKRCGNDMNEVVNKLFKYRGCVSHILLDLSGGKGIPMNPYAIRNQIRMINDQYGSEFSIAVAGELGPDTMELLQPLLSEFPAISIDSQGKLRRSGSALEPIDWDLAEEYLRKATEVLP